MVVDSWLSDPMVDKTLYDDGLVVLDENAVTLRRYYFPLGQAKRIPYTRIHRYEARGMSWLSGRARGWGSAHPGYWLPLDLHRFRRRVLVVLDLGGRVKPAFSPEDPGTVIDILSTKLGR